MMKTFFTADTHFRHRNIIKYQSRPFSDIDHMTEGLIANWNAVVGIEDTVHHVGDFGFGDVEQLQPIFDRLNGIKHLYIGNHDEAGSLIEGWASVQHYAEIKVDGQMIVLAHYAHRIWNKAHKGSWMLYGHSHGSLPDDPHALSIDVGVDCHKYRPIGMPDLHRIMKKKTWKAVDHHGRT
jgi:calcineurin-like phosphoesterase family protein